MSDDSTRMISRRQFAATAALGALSAAETGTIASTCAAALTVLATARESVPFAAAFVPDTDADRPADGGDPAARPVREVGAYGLATPDGGVLTALAGAVPQKSSIEAATEAFEQRLVTDAAPTSETAQALGRYQATGQKAGPDQPSGPTYAAPKNWTEKPKVEEEKPPEPPKEPISKKLLDFLQSLWRAGGNAIDVAQTGNLTLNPPKDADGPVTYADPSAKKTTGL